MCVPFSSWCSFWPCQHFFISTLLNPQLWCLAFSATLTSVLIWLKPRVFSIHLPNWKLHIYTNTKTKVVVSGPPNHPWNPRFHSISLHINQFGTALYCYLADKHNTYVISPLYWQTPELLISVILGVLEIALKLRGLPRVRGALVEVTVHHADSQHLLLIRIT